MVKKTIDLLKERALMIIDPLYLISLELTEAIIIAQILRDFLVKLIGGHLLIVIIILHIFIFALACLEGSDFDFFSIFATVH